MPPFYRPISIFVRAIQHRQPEDAPTRYPSNWRSLRRSVLERDGYRCCNCRRRRELHVHHIVPLARGGRNAASNLVTLCRACHERVEPHVHNLPRGKPDRWQPWRGRVSRWRSERHATRRPTRIDTHDGPSKKVIAR